MCIVELLKLRIDSCDFYECTSVIQLAQFYHVSNISQWGLFVEAVIALMKKKHAEAERSFQELEKGLEVSSPYFEYLHPLVKLYRGYCHFCLFQYEKAHACYIQYKTYTSTVLGRTLEDERVTYNTDLFEALMLYESGCLSDSLEKLNEIMQNSSTFEVHFYRLIVMMKIALSEEPFLGEMDSNEEILMYTLDLIPEIPDGASSPILLYYEALLKAYFGMFSEAEKIIIKSIEKA